MKPSWKIKLDIKAVHRQQEFSRERLNSKRNLLQRLFALQWVLYDYASESHEHVIANISIIQYIRVFVTFVSRTLTRSSKSLSVREHAKADVDVCGVCTWRLTKEQKSTFERQSTLLVLRVFSYLLMIAFYWSIIFRCGRRLLNSRNRNNCHQQLWDW